MRSFGQDYTKAIVLGSYGRDRPDPEARKALIDELEKRGVRF
mgnify:CR=1 FL=1